MDLTESIAPKSDQLNAEDLLTGPRTFTIAEVRQGSAEQPVDVHLVEFPGRPFKPSKTVRRIMVAAWGKDSAAYVGRRMTLYRDPAVKFGGMDVGGIRVSHMSHIDKRIVVALTVSRGKRAPYTVEPLKEEPKQPAQTAEPMTAKTRGHMFALFNELGIDEAAQYAGIAHILGHPIESRADLTETQGQQIVNRLKVKKAEKDAGADPVEPGLFEGQQ
jgi:hypothetical protein